MANGGRVQLSINDQVVEAEPGRILIDVAEEMGVFVPRFCYHPGMKSVAVCRMCLVKVEGQNKLLPACATPVADGMKVSTVDEQAVDAQKGMLEFLLINHPLDCPICDRAGECPLQDQTYKHGPGSTRYIEPKRTYEKALAISDLVVLDRERCVLCWRCVRFSDEIAGDSFIQLIDRGPGTQILTFKDEPFDSYFSGNTIQICPVGALTSKPYRFVSRPWDLTSAPSVCAYCSVGCPLTNDARAGKLVRTQALPNENVNDFWTCDKGRFGYHYVDSEDRLDRPLIRKGEEFEGASWGEAVAAVAAKLQDAKKVGVIAGGHLTTEDAFAISKLAKEVIGTPHVDSRIQDAGAPYELALKAGPVAGSTSTLNDLESARTILWLGPDPKEALPVLYLRLRKAVLDFETKLIVVSPRRMSLDAFATHVVRCEPGREASAVGALMKNTATPAEVATDLGDPFVACWGPGSPGRDETALFSAVVDLVNDRAGSLLVCPPHAGSQGMIDMGVYPSLDAGYQPVGEPGMDTQAILEAAASGDLDVLLLFGADPIADFPMSDLARKALEAGTFTVSVELFPTDSVALSDVVLPSAAYAEREGTFTNLERRLQKLEPLLPAPGSAAEPWRICASIAGALGASWSWNGFADVWADIKRSVVTHAGVDVEALAQNAPAPNVALQSGYADDAVNQSAAALAGPGAHYPKGYRQGSPFQTGQNWPLSWELRAFEARQRPGQVPSMLDGNGSAPPATRVSAPSEARRAQTGEGFALYTGRMIYDEGTMVSKTVALRGIARHPFIGMNPGDAAELGLSEGEEALVSANGFEVHLEVHLEDIASGAVFVPYDQKGLKTNLLITEMNPIVQVRRSS